MTDRKAARPERAPVLRSLYAVVFFGLALAAFSAGWPEFEQLYFALSHPYHFGEGPRLLTLIGAVVLAVAVGWVLVAFVRRKEIPLFASGALLGGVVLCLGGLGTDIPQGRSWAAADKEILMVASKVHRRMVDVLQTEGAVPRGRDAWMQALTDAAKQAPPPARTRMFLDVPWDVELVPEEGALPELLRPGTLAVYVAPQGEAFQIHPIGFSKSGEVAPLVDERGEPVVLRGTFNPESQLLPARAAPRLPPVFHPDGVAHP